MNQDNQQRRRCHTHTRARARAPRGGREAWAKAGDVCPALAERVGVALGLARRSPCGPRTEFKKTVVTFLLCGRSIAYLRFPFEL